MKDIKEMTFDELKREKDELSSLLYLTRNIGNFDDFNWKGLDFWDADRRHHKLSKEILMRSIIGNPEYNTAETTEEESNSSLKEYLKKMPEHHTQGDWKCKKSPIGFCIYDIEEDPEQDSCIHCGYPDERK
jgi:hypothetical protein